MAKGKPASIEVQETEEGRLVVMTYADGEVVRKLIDLKARPKRRPRKPFARLKPPPSSGDTT